MTPLCRSFYARNTVTVARELLGKMMVRRINGCAVSGIINETEAYRFSDDPASHAYRGPTERNSAMFSEVGRAYVYFTYGMHYCVNAVARSSRFEAGAVLIRSIKPEKGVGIMLENRGGKKDSELANGPAKLTQALQITKEQYGADLTKKEGELFIAKGIEGQKIIASPRIGIKNGTEKLWNFKINV